MDTRSDYAPNLTRLSDADDVDIASGEPDVRGWDVTLGDDTKVGEVDDLIVDRSAMKVRYLDVDLDKSTLSLDSDRHVLVPIAAAQLDTDDNEVVLRGYDRSSIVALPAVDQAQLDTSYDSRYRGSAAPPSTARERKLTRSAEELKVGRREVKAGEVHIGKHVETEHVSQPVQRSREVVNVSRRPASGDATDTRTSEKEIVVPVMEEEIVVEKRPVVKEELVVSKERTTEQQNVEADLKREEFDVDTRGRASVEGDTTRRGDR